MYVEIFDFIYENRLKTNCILLHVLAPTNDQCLELHVMIKRCINWPKYGAMM